MRVLPGLLGLLLIATVAPVRADLMGPPTAGLLDLDVSRTTYPTEDVVILYRGIDVEVDADGRVTRRVRRVQRLLTDLAIEHLGDERVAYDTTRQELTIDLCRTYMLDGSEVPAKPRAFNRVTPGRVASCPDRTGLQEMVISHLGVERGCLIELAYTLADRVAWRPWLEGIENLGDGGAVLQGEVRIRTPGPLQSAVIGDPPNLHHTDHPNTWTYGPMPGIPDEGWASERERTPHLIYSTCPSWEELGDWLLGRLEEASVPDEAIRAWTGEPLESGRPPLNDEERLSRAGWLLAGRTMGTDDTPLAWWLPIRPAARVFDTSCGNLLDRAALAAATCRAWGIPVRVALLPEVSHVVHEVPALVQFGDLWLVAGSRSLSIAQGVAAAAPDPGSAGEFLLLKDDGVERVPLSPNVASSTLALRIHEEEDNSVRGEAALRLGGGVCSRLGYNNLGAFLDRLAGELVKGGKVAGYVVEALGTDTLAVTISLTGDGFGESVGQGRRRWTIPSVPGMGELVIPGVHLLIRPERQTALTLPYAVDETVDLLLEPSKATQTVIVPREQRVEGGGAVLEVHVERTDDAWRIRRRFVSREGQLSPQDYPAFRDVVVRRLEGSSNDIYLSTGDDGE